MNTLRERVANISQNKKEKEEEEKNILFIFHSNEPD